MGMDGHNGGCLSLPVAQRRVVASLTRQTWFFSENCDNGYQTVTEAFWKG